MATLQGEKQEKRKALVDRRRSSLVERTGVGSTRSEGQGQAASKPGSSAAAETPANPQEAQAETESGQHRQPPPWPRAGSWARGAEPSRERSALLLEAFSPRQS